MKVLVAYASVTGSTRGIAERIGERLGNQGVEVDVLPVEGVSDVSGYDAVVVGSAIHRQSWLPEATRFMQTCRDGLVRRPVWLFSVGMPAALPRALRKWGPLEESKALAPFQDLVHPRGDRLFSGVVRADQLNLRGRLALRLMGGRYGDYRDWAEIEAWADDIGRRVLTEVG